MAKHNKMAMPYTLNVFADAEGRGGNPCTLYSCNNKPDKLTLGFDNTVCYTWPISQAKLTFGVSCYTHTHAIQCCGHGLLAAASLHLTREESPVFLLMNDSKIKAFKEDKKVWLRFNRVSVQACAVPDWLYTLIANRDACAAAETDDEQGYLVIEWPHNYPLKALERPGVALAKYSRKGVIYTATSNRHAIDIQYRYFAPQYGVAEDPATGSAMRILADYWASKSHALSAWQCSDSGGYLLSKIEDTYAYVGGFYPQVTGIE